MAHAAPTASIWTMLPGVQTSFWSIAGSFRSNLFDWGMGASHGMPAMRRATVGEGGRDRVGDRESRRPSRSLARPERHLATVEDGEPVLDGQLRFFDARDRAVVRSRMWIGVQSEPINFDQATDPTRFSSASWRIIGTARDPTRDGLSSISPVAYRHNDRGAVLDADSQST